MQKGSSRIYWANAMFSEADRDFNSKCVGRLREVGYDVFLPQEAGVNKTSSPSAKDIFVTDTSAIMGSDIMIACIDQESIDCGVAAEIGIAYAYGIPVIGIYTDMRQYRIGEGRMYKNPYVVGAIEANGELTSTIEEVIEAVGKYVLRSPTQIQEDASSIRKDIFNNIASDYTAFIRKLESWYEPLWSIETSVVATLSLTKGQRVLDFGCGTGEIGRAVTQMYPHSLYIGYDESEQMVQRAIALNAGNESCNFSSSWPVIQKHSPFDVILFSFVLHDVDNPIELINNASNLLHSDGSVVITDLTTWDLPKLTNFLRCELARPHKVVDRRFNPNKIKGIVDNSNFNVVDCQLAMPTVHFPSSDELDQYLRNFGVYKGMDLPLGLRLADCEFASKRVKKALKACAYPFVDQRAFVTCTLKQAV